MVHLDNRDQQVNQACLEPMEILGQQERQVYLVKPALGVRLVLWEDLVRRDNQEPTVNQEHLVMLDRLEATVPQGRLGLMVPRVLLVRLVQLEHREMRER